MNYMTIYFDTANTKKQDACLTANAMIGWEWERFSRSMPGVKTCSMKFMPPALLNGNVIGLAGQETLPLWHHHPIQVLELPAFREKKSPGNHQ